MKLKWAHFIKDELFFFFLRAPHIFSDKVFFSTSAVVGYQLNWSEGWEHSSTVNPSDRILQDFKPHWSEKDKTACRIKIHSARGTSCGGIDPYTLMAQHGPHQTRRPNPIEKSHADLRTARRVMRSKQRLLDDQGDLVG
jgi:hypothetical protein